MMQWIKFFLIIILLVTKLFANFYEENKIQGFYFFEDPKKAQEDKKPESPEEAVAMIQEKKMELYQLRCLALLSPTQENIIRYIEKQNAILKVAAEFAIEWQYALLDMPLLGDSTNPTTHIGIDLRKKVEEAKKQTTLEALRKKYFLLFFCEGKEPYSEKVGEIVKIFSDITYWEVRAVSLNGIAVSSFPDFELDKGISKKYGVHEAPSFFIVNPDTMQSYPIGAGILSASDLIENIYKQSNRYHLLEAQ